MICILTLVLETLFLLISKSVLTTTFRPGIDVLFILLFTLALIYELGKNRHLKQVSIQILLGYFFRIVLMFWDIYFEEIFRLPNSGADSVGYYNHSVLFMETGSALYGGLFSKVMGTLYKVIGPSRISGQFINVLASVVTLLVIYYILCEIDLSEVVKRKTILILAFIPNYAILSSIFLRESFITLFCTISFYFFIKWFKESKSRYFVFAFVFVFVASAFHSGVVGIAVGYIAVVLLYNQKEKNFHSNLKNIIPAFFLVVVVAFLYINYADVLFGKMVRIEGIEDIAPNRESGGSSYAQYVGSSGTPLNMIIYTIPRIIYYMFSPFPWQWRDLSDIIAFVFSSCFYLMVVCRVIGYLRRNKQNKNRYLVLALSIVAICVVFIFAWGVNNTGTAIRHRDKVIALFATLYALTHKEKHSKKIVFSFKKYK